MVIIPGAVPQLEVRLQHEGIWLVDEAGQLGFRHSSTNNDIPPQNNLHHQNLGKSLLYNLHLYPPEEPDLFLLTLICSPVDNHLGMVCAMPGIRK